MKINLTKSVVAVCASLSITTLTGLAGVAPDADISIKGNQSSCCCSTARPDAHAPIGVMGDHVHKKGEWMVSYRAMTMEMNQVFAGSNSIGGNAGYMLAPQQMTMEMNMLGIMYAPTDKLTLMAMSSYKHNTMDMQNPAGVKVMEMKSSGLGDTGFGAYYQIINGKNSSGSGSHNAHMGLSVSLPTGDIDKKAPNGRDLPFPMQLGSGTYDFTPSITYNHFINDLWSWGAQAKTTLHTGTNDSGYTLGDSVNVTSWVARNINKRFSVSGRVNFNAWSGVDGTQTNSLNGMNPNMSLPADPNNTGGSRTDLYLGVNYIHCSGVRFATEIGKTVYQDLQGAQLGNDWSLNFGVQYAW